MFKSQPSSSMSHLKSRDLLGGIWHQMFVWDILGFPFHFPYWLGGEVDWWVVFFHIGCQTGAHYSVKYASAEVCSEGGLFLDFTWTAIPSRYSGSGQGSLPGTVGWISPNLHPLSGMFSSLVAFCVVDVEYARDCFSWAWLQVPWRGLLWGLVWSLGGQADVICIRL